MKFDISLTPATTRNPLHHRRTGFFISRESRTCSYNDQIEVPALIRVAIAHYQFETIHPFLDGNGRIGRLMITRYLVSEGILEKPLLYLSEYFENNKALYYDNLTRVRTHNNMLQWIKYFLVGVERKASNAIDTLSKVIQLKNDLEFKINSSFGRRSNSVLTLLNILFQSPVTTIDNAAKKCLVSYKAANDLVRIILERKMVDEMTGQSRNRIFIFKSYLDIFSD